MDVFRTVIPKGIFYTGNGGADSVAKPLVASWGFPEIFKGILLRASSNNTIDIFVGPRGVTPDNGFPLSKTQEVLIQVDDPTSIYLCAAPASNSTQTITLSGDGSGDTFTLTYGGQSTSPIAYDAVAATVQTALEGLFGTGNVTVTSDGPYVCEFVARLLSKILL